MLDASNSEPAACRDKKHTRPEAEVREKREKITSGLSRRGGTKSCMASQGEVQAIHENIMFSRGDAEKKYILSVPARGGTKIK